MGLRDQAGLRAMYPIYGEKLPAHPLRELEGQEFRQMQTLSLQVIALVIFHSLLRLLRLAVVVEEFLALLAAGKVADYLAVAPLWVCYQPRQSRLMYFAETKHTKDKKNSSNRRLNLGNKDSNSRAIFKPGLFRLARRQRSTKQRNRQKQPYEANMPQWE